MHIALCIVHSWTVHYKQRDARNRLHLIFLYKSKQTNIKGIKVFTYLLDTRWIYLDCMLMASFRVIKFRVHKTSLSTIIVLAQKCAGHGKWTQSKYLYQIEYFEHIYAEKCSPFFCTAFTRFIIVSILEHFFLLIFFILYVFILIFHLLVDLISFAGRFDRELLIFGRCKKPITGDYNKCLQIVWKTKICLCARIHFVCIVFFVYMLHFDVEYDRCYKNNRHNHHFCVYGTIANFVMEKKNKIISIPISNHLPLEIKWISPFFHCVSCRDVLFSV